MREVEVVYILDERDSHLQKNLGWVGRDEKEASVKGSKREGKQLSLQTQGSSMKHYLGFRIHYLGRMIV